jgi:hypothetical protein
MASHHKESSHRSFLFTKIGEHIHRPGIFSHLAKKECDFPCWSVSNRTEPLLYYD